MLRMNNVLILAFTILLSFANQAWATDDIICTSRKFMASLAVGSDGYVASMVLANTSANYFSEVLQITNFARRQVSISDRAINVEATLGMKNANKLVISLERGKGYIDLDSYREEMTCDWKT
jgi:hypothetical protein